MNKKLFGIAAILASLAITACGPTSNPTTNPTVDPTSDPTSEPEPTPPPFIAPEAISAIGTINGTNWDTDFDLSSSDEGHNWTISNFTLKEGQEWKLRKNHNWGTAGTDNWGYSFLDETTKALFSGSDNIIVNTSGVYTVNFDYDNFVISATLDKEDYTMSFRESSLVLYEGQTGNLEVVFSKEVDDNLAWESSDTAIASVLDGVVTANAPGTVTITATNMTNPDIAPIEATVEVRKVQVKGSSADGYTNVDNIAQENAFIKVTQDSGAGYPGAETFSQIEFNVEPSTNYYARATFNQEGMKWVWSRFGIVNKEQGVDFSRGLYYSRADNNNKIILTENPNTWGATTDRNQYWNFFADHDFTNATVELIREGNAFYYFLDGKLIVSETINSVFNDKATVPAISIVDSNATITNMYASTNPEEYADITARIPRNGYGFWGSYEDNVVVDNAAGTVTFKNNTNAWPFDNIKDNAAFACGDLGAIPAQTSAKYDFDIKFTDFGADADGSYAAMSFKPYSNPNDGIRTLMINKYRGAVNGWGWNGGCGNAQNEAIDYETPMSLENTYHVTITRDITKGFILNVCGIEKVWPWDDVNDAFIPMFNAYKCNVEISNITYTVL